ncbi:MAG: lamin tail domain-containing protein [Thermoproteota archaeon]
MRKKSATIILVASLVVATYILYARPASALIREGDVLINEIELNPRGNDIFDDTREAIELYNTKDAEIDLTNWTLSSDDGITVIIENNTIIDRNGFAVIKGPRAIWLDDNSEYIFLRDEFGQRIDSVGVFSDTANDGKTWQRVPDGTLTWEFGTGTLGSSNVRPQSQSPEQESSISISTDKNSYSDLEDIMIRGMVEGIAEDSVFVVVRVAAPDGSLYAAKTVHLQDNGTYALSLKFYAANMQEGQMFEISARYNGAVDYAYFEYAGAETMSSPRFKISMVEFHTKDINDRKIHDLTVGVPVVLSTLFKSNYNEQLSIVVVTEVFDEHGTATHIQLQKRTINPYKHTETWALWQPEDPGVYMIRSFVLSSLDRAEILSPVIAESLDVR